MNSIIRVEHRMFADCLKHLLPDNSQNEQSAFLFARVETVDNQLEFHVLESWHLKADDFDIQEPDFLQMCDATRARIIKHAHERRCSLIEMHSHPGPYAACFSGSDLTGFEETVPNVMWRLKGAPYAAIVVAVSGVDALVWRKWKQPPSPLAKIVTGRDAIVPTQLTMRRLQ